MKHFTPTQKIAQNAKKGMELNRLEKGGKCARSAGWKRAKQLSKRQKVSLNDIKTMRAWFARHAKNRKNEPPRCGLVVWLMWGGTEAWRWADKIWEKHGK